MFRPVSDPSFLNTVKNWLGEVPELFVMFRYANSGGSRDYEIHSSWASIVDRLGSTPAKTSVIAFREPQLQIRGKVSESFICNAILVIPDGTEFLMVETDLTTAGSRSWYHQASGVGHAELRDELESSFGRHVMLGPYPPWLEDGPDVISGYVADADGQVRPGAY